MCTGNFYGLVPLYFGCRAEKKKGENLTLLHINHFKLRIWNKWGLLSLKIISMESVEAGQCSMGFAYQFHSEMEFHVKFKCLILFDFLNRIWPCICMWGCFLVGTDCCSLLLLSVLVSPARSACCCLPLIPCHTCFTCCFHFGTVWYVVF